MASEIETKQNAHEEIRKIPRNINDAGVKGSPEKLEKYFHEDMVFAQSPGLWKTGNGKRRVRG